MARIPDQEVQRLKDDISVQRLIETSGVELRKSGKDLSGKCPFHADDTASLVITPAKNLWHCFGCQTGGGPIDWVMKLRGVSFRHAVELLKDDSALAADPVGANAGGESVKRSTVRSLPAPVALDADDRALLLQVVAYYQQSLKDGPEALAYLQSRGLNHPDLIDTFKLGFANRTLGLRMPDKRRLEGAQMRSRLERLGVYRESGHEHFNGSLVVPVLDEHGQVREMYGRKITDKHRPDVPLHMYLRANPLRGRGVFNVAALAANTNAAGAVAKEIILCESIIDALTFWCAGFRNVTTAYGVEGFTDELLAAFKTHQVTRVLIAYDRDEAGDKAADKLASRLMDDGMECYRIQFPKGMDANEYALKVTPAAKSLGILIRQATWLGKGKPAERSTVPVEPDLPLKSASSPINTSASSYESSSELVQQEPPISLAAEPAEVAAPTVTAVDIDTLPVQRATAPELVAEVNAAEVLLHFGEGAKARRWRVRGLAKNLAYEVLKVNVLAGCGDAFHVDTFDLYAARARAQFITQAASELGVSEDVLKADLGRVLLKLEALQDAQIQEALAPKKSAAAAPALSLEEHAAALGLLKSPDMAGRILADFEACGVVGESTNKLVGYLAAVSRKLAHPLAIVIQSSSAAGKSSLMDAILAFVPEEERIQYSAMTGQSLFYMGQTNLKNKILAIAEEEGASKASYALKLLQSEGELTIASTGTDPATGNLITQEYRVEGPMSLFMTTTAIDIDEELMNRCLVLSVDENREQTRAIHQLQRQRRTLEGLQRKHEKQAILAVHRNAQRLLRTLAVVNPYADKLTFLDDRTRTRRDHEKYLTLIDTITLLHQCQRQIKTTVVADKTIEYIEATLADIELANKIAHEVLGTSLDELPPQTRRVFAQVRELVRARMRVQGTPQKDIRFSRAELRAATGASDTQLKVHLARLAELEYLLIHRVLRGQGFAYELLDDRGDESTTGDSGHSKHLPGLIDAAALQASQNPPIQPPIHDYDAQRSASNGEQSATGRGVVGMQSGGGHTAKNSHRAHESSVPSDLPLQTAKPRATPVHDLHTPYTQTRTGSPSLAAAVPA